MSALTFTALIIAPRWWISVSLSRAAMAERVKELMAATLVYALNILQVCSLILCLPNVLLSVLEVSMFEMPGFSEIKYCANFRGQL